MFPQCLPQYHTSLLLSVGVHCVWLICPIYRQKVTKTCTQKNPKTLTTTTKKQPQSRELLLPDNMNQLQNRLQRWHLQLCTGCSWSVKRATVPNTGIIYWFNRHSYSLMELPTSSLALLISSSLKRPSFSFSLFDYLSLVSPSPRLNLPNTHKSITKSNALTSEPHCQ